MNENWTEFDDLSEEIFDLDIPELRDYDEVTEEETWNAFLSSNWDF
jgi:hypothetical protein